MKWDLAFLCTFIYQAPFKIVLLMVLRVKTKEISMEMVINYDKETIEGLSVWIPSHFQIKPQIIPYT